jgi:hypothetical protein
MNNQYGKIYGRHDDKKRFGRVSEQSSVITGGQSGTGQFKLQATFLIPTRPPLS